MIREIKVIAFVFITVLVLEVGMRAWGSRLSLNMQTIDNIPRVRDSQQAIPRRVLVLGNSMILEGVDFSVVETYLEDLPTRQSLGMQTIALHGAFIGEWNWMVRSWFGDCDKMPTDLIINCDPASLLDGSIALRRVGWNTSPSTPWWDMPNCSLHTIDDRCEFLLSRFSSLFSRSQDVGTAIKQRLVPHFQASTAFVNVSTGVNTKSSTSLAASFDETKGCSLNELLALCQTHSTKVWLVWMPTTERKHVDSQLLGLLSRYEVTDLTVDVSLELEDFVDSNHLSASGKKKFSPAYARTLLETIQNSEVY